MLKLVTPDAPAASAAGGDAPSSRYWAFLSYSHHDKAIAKRLQKQLETYRVPRRLVGRTTSHGEVPARVSPVFRDRDELHAGADLKASVQDALSRSRWLIVVCTPDAARSPWVNREIIEFKKLHGERRVLALIARGEPFASDKPGREAEECFPPALRRALNEQGLPEGEPLEPIAADMRREGDGPHRAMLKLLAGMLGVAFDDLVRRDVQRRLRWLTAIASASVVGVVVFALLAVLAVQARNEAQHQRQQAEGLIEFMLGDLRKKLEPVGRLEVLDSVGEKALAYYGSQEAGALDATALGHRSRAMHLIGEIRYLRANPGEAQEAFEQAAYMTQQLLARSPNDGQRIFDHAQSVYWVGHAAWKRADGKVAERWWQEYLSLAQRLVALDASNLDWQTELAFAHMNLGTLQVGTGQLDTALRSLSTAIELFRKLVPQRKELAIELANAMGWSAVVRARLGDYAGSLVAQKEQLGLLEAVPDWQKNRAAQRGVLQSLNLVSDYQLALGRLQDAEASVFAGLKIADDLVAVDPNNAFWRSDACNTRLRAVEVLVALDRTIDARNQFKQAAGCIDQLAKAGSMGLNQDIRAQSRSIVLAAVLNPGPEVIERATTFLDRATAQLGTVALDRESLSVHLANAAIAIGRLQRDESSDASTATWRRAEALLAPFSQSRDGAVLTPLAQARLLLGDVPGARVLADRIERTSYRHPAYAGLVKQMQAGQGSKHSANSGARG